jgi:molybdopterin-guanine dinucleotide biosynthesis protein A
MVVGGIVLAGGKSSRMGRPKASLEWHGSTLLRRIAGLVARSVDGPIVIVRSAGQTLPRLPDAFEVVADVHAGRGPLEGLAAGLRALAGRADAAYVSSTDVPFLHTSFVGAVVGGLGAGEEICVPVVGRGWQPLAAAYRTSVIGALDELLAADERRVSGLLDRCRVNRIGAAALLENPAVARWDPGLESVVNLNDPAAYVAALARPAPEIAVTWSVGVAATARELDGEAASVRAATLGALADSLGVALEGGLVARVSGGGTSVDRGFPLESGDAVVFDRISGGWALMQ